MAGQTTQKGEVLTQRPRGRPSAKTVEKIDEAIVRAALEIFLERGFEAASIEGIAKRAGVTKRTIYARFPDKKALFCAVVEETIGNWSAQASQFDHLMPADLAGRLRFHLDTMVRGFGSPEIQTFSRMVEQTTDSFPELARIWQQSSLHAFHELMVADLQSASDTPDGEVDWHFIATMLVHSLSGWLRSGSVVSTPSEPETHEFTDKIIAAVMCLAVCPSLSKGRDISRS